MSETIPAYFDGKAIIPESPLELPIGQQLLVQIETVDSDAYPLAQIGELATDMG